MKIESIEVMDYSYTNITIPYTLEELEDILDNKRLLKFKYNNKNIILKVDYIISIAYLEENKNDKGLHIKQLSEL